jgi:hypothetical protein
MDIEGEWFPKTINDLSNRSKLTDINIIMIMSILKKFNFKNIRHSIIDSLFTPIIFKIIENREYNLKKSQIEKFKAYFNNNDIVIIPIYYDDHWSLLIYIKKDNTIIHFDSAPISHHDYVHKLMCHIKLINIHIKHKKKLPIITQNGRWECGYNIIMYYVIFMTNYGLKDYINDIIEKIKISNIQLFIDTLQELMNYHHSIYKTRKDLYII